MKGLSGQDKQMDLGMSNRSPDYSGAPDADDAAGEGVAVERPRVGRQLKAAREARGMTVDEVSRALKLSLRQVEALEIDDWSSLPGKTIIRGFVRNYARLVGVDAEALMGAMAGANLPKSPELAVSVGTPVSLPQEGKADRKDLVRVLIGLLVLALAVLAYFFSPPDVWKSAYQAFVAATRSNETARDAESATSAAPDTTQEAHNEAAVPAPVETLAPSPQEAVEAKPAASVAAPAAPTAEAAPAAASSALQFSFAQPSWVEVRDRNGQVIFSQKSPAGSQKTVEGQPPYSVVIGNAGHVTLQYKGQPVDLSKRSREDVARLTLE